jgi:hypothetical protein
MGVDDTEECSEAAFRIRLGIKRPGIVAVAQLGLYNVDVDQLQIRFKKQCDDGIIESRQSKT